MSHAWGEVIHGAKIVGHYEYNGTADVAISHIYDTHQEVMDNWRSSAWSNCTCGQPPVDVLLYSSYGGGFHWRAKVCLECHAIVDGLTPFEGDGGIETIDGHPLGPVHEGAE